MKEKKNLKKVKYLAHKQGLYQDYANAEKLVERNIKLLVDIIQKY